MSYTQQKDSQPIRVLLADDDEDQLAMMDFVAKSKGWETVCVTTAQAIIDAVNEQMDECDFDAIVTDVNFLDVSKREGPRLTGVSAIRQIRKVKDDIPVLFVTAYVNSIMREEARRVSAEIISKPIMDVFKLFEHIENLVIWHRLSTMRDYEGEEKRVNSVNRTSNRRRKTDRIIESPQILRTIISEVREEEHKLCAESNTTQKSQSSRS